MAVSNSFYFVASKPKVEKLLFRHCYYLHYRTREVYRVPAYSVALICCRRYVCQHISLFTHHQIGVSLFISLAWLRTTERYDNKRY